MTSGNEGEEGREVQPEEIAASASSQEEAAVGEATSDESGAEEEDSRFHWYAVHTYSGYEKSVSKAISFLSETHKELKGKIARIYVPTEQVKTRRLDGREMRRERALFPGYVFLRMELTRDVVNVCTAAPKVIGFVKSGDDELQMFTDEEITAIEEGKKQRQRAGVREVPFAVGDRVKIVEGLFAPFSGDVEDVSGDKKRLKVTVGIFGRPIPVELSFDQVELAGEED
ncbi:MAG TPA: transcription termination/antitermination protein NusG [bacterium]|nr:transcription termination/antitermination protein NusG [bacterium]